MNSKNETATRKELKTLTAEELYNARRILLAANSEGMTIDSLVNAMFDELMTRRTGLRDFTEKEKRSYWEHRTIETIPEGGDHVA